MIADLEESRGDGGTGRRGDGEIISIFHFSFEICHLTFVITLRSARSMTNVK